MRRCRGANGDTAYRERPGEVPIDRFIVFTGGPGSDAERRQSVAEAEATFHAVSAAYIDHAYELVTLPCVPLAARVDFVLERLRHERTG